jgi:hypothetical protein
MPHFISCIALWVASCAQVVYYNEVVKNDDGYTLDPPKTETRMLTDMSEAEVLAVVSAFKSLAFFGGGRVTDLRSTIVRTIESRAVNHRKFDGEVRTLQRTSLF